MILVKGRSRALQPLGVSAADTPPPRGLLRACPVALRAGPAAGGQGLCALRRVVRLRLLCLCRYTGVMGTHTLNVTRDITRSMKDLESDIVELEEMSESTGDRGCIEILKVKKLALANLLESKVQGALVRSRFQNIAEMDTPSGFFFGLERKNGQKKSTNEEDNTLQEEFCSGLPQVSTETNSRLAEPLRLCELQAALQSMQGQRAPGIDGLTVEFYKAFWDILAADILDVFNESLTYGSMPVSCRRAVLTLLPKKGNLQDIKNWRPVSLLCVDYKLLSKALANRLREAMEQVIHRDQTYCVPGRSMVDNVYLIRDVLEVSSFIGNRYWSDFSRPGKGF
ncbi:hypothetical protein L3Q82_026126 [Scortum barcoo]|uniref:Uncharacterized protein n=1 Tax=Scortum barcoo TaxID=214431 RepID=A0ACB8WMW7_9TELE|nr:hypothetical protein L3Q82_026126 [Scortum barcoo]